MSFVTLGRFAQGYLLGEATDGGLYESRIIPVPTDARGSSHHQHMEMARGIAYGAILLVLLLVMVANPSRDRSDIAKNPADHGFSSAAVAGENRSR